MQRRIPILVGASVIAIVVVASVYLMSHPADTHVSVSAPTAQPTATTTAVPPASVAATPPAFATKTTAQWIADTASGDAATRAAAIEALAEAPRAEALPVLGRILTDGEPQVDRVLALRSLRDLALNQGDADGAVRDAVRHAIYHGDDQTKVDDVQEALEIIEESEQHQ